MSWGTEVRFRASLRVCAPAIASFAMLIALVPSARPVQAEESTKQGARWYLERGRTNMEIGNFSAAIEAYRRAAEIDPDNREAMKQLGLAYEKQGLTTKAIQQFDRYLERFQDDPEIAFKQADYLGWSRFDYRRDDAIRYYRMGLEMREDVERRHELARLLAKEREQLHEAVEQYRLLLESQPDNEEWRAEYRELLVWDDRYLEEAIREYRKLVEGSGGDFERQHTYAKLLARDDPRSDEVVSLYAALVKRRPGDAALRREYAELLSADPKRRSEAIREWRILIEEDPEPAARYELARLLSKERSQLDEALEQYRLLLDAEPDNAEWRAEYRKLLLWDEGRLPEAIEEYRQLASEKPEDLDVQRTLAALLARRDPRSDEALSLYTKLVQRNPADMALRIEYADALSAHPARRSQAIDEYRALLERDPRPGTRHKLARLLAEDREQLDEALAQYRSLVESEPGNHAWRAEYRELLLWDERYLDEAVEEHRRFAAGRPGDFEARYTLAELLAREDPGSEEALELYGNLVAAAPRDSALRLEYADLLAGHDERRSEAIEEYRTVLSADPRPATRHKLARLLAQERGQLDEAVEEYRILVAAEPDNAEWRAEYRKLLLWDERYAEEAIREYRMLASQKPGDFAVHHTLAKLLAREDPRSEEAVALYADLVRSRPEDADLRLEYAGLLAADPEQRTDAIRQYYLLLKEEPNRPARKALAGLLAGREDTRHDALEQYRILLRAEPDDTDTRLRHARLLATEREDTHEAIEEYQAVLEKEPRSGEAHAGLASAHAWLRNRQEAFQHANLAVDYGARDSRLLALRKDLLREREPNLKPFVRGFLQRGTSEARLDGFAGGLAGRADAGRLLTLRAEAGGEHYWRGGDAAGGAFGHVGGDIHADDHELALGFGYHTLGERSFVGHAAFSHRGEDWTVGAGGERKLRYDSFVALAGDRVNGRPIGSARENRIFLRARFEGERGEFLIEPYGGLVDAKSVTANPFGGARARTSYRVFASEHLDISPLLEVEAFHYRFNAFGVDLEPGEPAPGGYFSPQLFAQGVPGLALTVRLGGNHFLDLEGGPAIQLTKQGGDAMELDVGGEGRLSYVAFLHPSIYWSLELALESFGAAYTRTGATTSLGIEF